MTIMFTVKKYWHWKIILPALCVDKAGVRLRLFWFALFVYFDDLENEISIMHNTSQALNQRLTLYQNNNLTLRQENALYENNSIAMQEKINRLELELKEYYEMFD